MKRFYIQHEFKNTDHPAFDLMDKVREALMTPDMQAASAAGCHIDVLTFRNQEGVVTIKAITREKVSIMRMPDGTPISVIKEPKV